MTRSWLLPVVIAAVAAIAVAALGATITDLGPWYQGLVKPDWTPPDPAFGLGWTVIFTATAIAGVTAWRAAPTSQVSDTLVGLFAFNAFLNISWSLLFFRVQRPDWAFAELVILWLSILALIIICARYSKLSALLLVPYLVWVSFAGALNWQIIALNGPFG